MPDLDENPVRVQSPISRGPVFVDASGRRLRRVKLAGLAAAALVAGYLVLLLVAFIGGSNVAAPYLPIPVPAAGDRPAPPANGAGNGGPAESMETPGTPPAVEPPPAGTEAVPVAEPAGSAAPEPTAAVPADAAATHPAKNDEAPGQAKRRATPTHP
ncbi:hypothetical protein [Arthrobacter cupressi]|uniref:hypothetical protein n=1 Tax=Arthrobacter cupressi TaxID=1045773 RepID=UPI000943F45F|nr:hypothetical protein [Arthrobacter cupressi]NYD79734.1 hypothetical protein [Arthrobacter cupressi]